MSQGGPGREAEALLGPTGPGTRDRLGLQKRLAPEEPTAMPTRTRKNIYQPVLDLPPLSAEELAGLRASIALHGVLVPIMLAEDGRIIDGSNRKEIADELGVECPEVVQAGLEED